MKFGPQPWVATFAGYYTGVLACLEHLANYMEKEWRYQPVKEDIKVHGCLYSLVLSSSLHSIGALVPRFLGVWAIL